MVLKAHVMALQVALETSIKEHRSWYKAPHCEITHGPVNDRAKKDQAFSRDFFLFCVDNSSSYLHIHTSIRQQSSFKRCWLGDNSP